MKRNEPWHLAHPLPRDATLEERLDWYVLHAEKCGCRDMPDSIRRELEARGWTMPTPRSLK